ncbi:hypothetical protein [Sporosarcina sp. FSL W7-1283]|uniref:hypothetical protein n=1 Tax=Sporosarcina sp. FSL W7-1283 TaxID=2921560 RepID=UPI0030F5DF59
MMQRIRVPINILKCYRETVKGNENATLEEVQKKFTRNIKLAEKYARSNGRSGYYYVYGSLHFAVDKHGTVVYMRNHRYESDWKQKEYLKEHLNRMLKLNKEEAK